MNTNVAQFKRTSTSKKLLIVAPRAMIAGAGANLILNAAAGTIK